MIRNRTLLSLGGALLLPLSILFSQPGCGDDDSATEADCILDVGIYELNDDTYDRLRILDEDLYIYTLETYEVEVRSIATGQYETVEFYFLVDDGVVEVYATPHDPAAPRLFSFACDLEPTGITNPSD